MKLAQLVKTTIIFMFLILNLSIKAQVFEGEIYDQTKNKVEGAYIVDIKNGEHAHSDANGQFILKNIMTGDTLQISYLGHETVNYLVKDLSQKASIQLNESYISIDEIVITPGIRALNVFSDIDIFTNPVNTSQDILRKVPGLFIGQHAGGGKAEQIFLRGFDIDHGTDIRLTVDGMPINMVSHAHGQGYADLHFIIPESIERLEFGKGPYYAAQGNFTTAGYVSFNTKEKLDNNLIKLDYGQFNTKRILGMLNVMNTDNHSIYLASEFNTTDGPFESSQNFYRTNVMAKYTGHINKMDKISFLASYFESRWDASGQVPTREINNGNISRFGSIDDTEGGNTGRTNLRFNYLKNIDKTSFLKSNVYYSKYDFELYSNFTFFLNDAVNGDQIKQKESRNIFGVNSEYNKSFGFGNHDGLIQLGVELRNDLSKDNELSNTVNRRETLGRVKFGQVNETNLGAYANGEFNFHKLTINPALRVDQFTFNYNDYLNPLYKTQAETKAIFSPKLNFIYNQSNAFQLFLKLGKGFHSNDTRVILDKTTNDILPSAYGSDLGFIYKPFKNMIVNAAYWYLYLQQEFVYVGDAGIVEPSGKTKRQGIDLGLRYEPIKRLILNIDGTYTLARSIGEELGNDFIPLAPDYTMVGGLNYSFGSGFNTGLNMRYLDNRPANEDNSIVALGYTVFDFNLGYRYKNIETTLSIQNVTNTEWNETQFATESRLRNEVEPVEEIHFTPGTPFFAKFSLGYKF